MAQTVWVELMHADQPEGTVTGVYATKPAEYGDGDSLPINVSGAGWGYGILFRSIQEVEVTH